MLTCLKLPYVHSRGVRVSKYIVGREEPGFSVSLSKKKGEARTNHMVMTWNW